MNEYETATAGDSRGVGEMFQELTQEELRRVEGGVSVATPDHRQLVYQANLGARVGPIIGGT